MEKTLEDDLKDRFCSKPFEFAAIYPIGIGSFQCCWLTKSMGEVNENVSVQEVWNSESAQEVRKSILDGSFRYCKKDICPHMHNGDLPKKDQIQDKRLKEIIDENKSYLDYGPQIFQLNNDRTCNLSCPSCRTELILDTSGPYYERMLKTFNLSITEEALEKTREVSLTGSGDPFASKIYRDFLLNLDGSRYPHLQINLYTNGVLFDQEMWRKMHKIQRNISHLRISLDGISEDIYNNTRRGGNLERVKKNVVFLAQLHQSGFFKDLVLCFVVQKMNYQDMIPFVEFAKTLPGVTVLFQKIYNWGTYSPTKFILHDICDERNPDFDNFLSVLRNPLFSDPIVDLGNITPFRNRAMSDQTIR